MAQRRPFHEGHWYMTQRNRRIVYLVLIEDARGRAWAVDVEKPTNRGWVLLSALEPNNYGLVSEYNMRRWQPWYGEDEYLEN